MKLTSLDIGVFKVCPDGGWFKISHCSFDKEIGGKLRTTAWVESRLKRLIKIGLVVENAYVYDKGYKKKPFTLACDCGWLGAEDTLERVHDPKYPGLKSL